MTEFVYSVRNPYIVGEFDAQEAQAFANEYVRLLDDSRKYRVFKHEKARDHLIRFGARLIGQSNDDSQIFWENAHTWVENVHLRQADPDENESKWHFDHDYKGILPFDLGASSLPSEIVCGDVQLDYFPVNEMDLQNHLISRRGQLAVNRSLEKGDAWLYTADEPLEGKIVRMPDPTIHRKSHVPAPYEGRFLLRSPIDD